MTVITQPTTPPATLNTFIGRERELDDLSNLLTGGDARLVTLTGAGGCGKTRLALSLAERASQAAAFEHGACLVELAGVETADLVNQSVAAAVGLPEASDQPQIEALCQYFQDKHLLLILDNCEHLLPGCLELARALLPACPRLRLLATSREPLGLAEETVWLVPSLALPAGGPATPLREVLAADAVRLFVARAQAALPGFELTESNAAAVAQICRRLDGIPLAIELAAARVKMLSLEQITDRLEQGLQLLARGRPLTTPRHQTMRAAIDWSYSLLSPPAQRLFRRLAVFAGGFTLEAVERICSDPQPAGDAPALLRSEALDRLSDLVDKSMVWIAERAAGEPVRYRLLEPIRQYALAQLRDSGEAAATREWHLAYFVEFAEQAEPELRTENQLHWLRRLDHEHDNLRAALAWSMRAAGGSLAGLRIASALCRYWYQRGYGHEGRRWLGQAIAIYDDHPAEHNELGQRCLARALVADGFLGDMQGDFKSIAAGLERGLILARELADLLTQTYALGLLGLLSGYRGDDLSIVRQFSDDTLTSARRSGDIWALGWAMLLFGLHAYYQWHDLGGAQSALEESDARFRQMGDRRWRAVVANLRGTLSANAGDYAAAQRLYAEALAIALEIGDVELAYKENFNSAGLAVVQGDLTRAEERYARALEGARGRGARLGIAESLQGLAEIALRRGDLPAAEALLRECLPLAREVAVGNHVARLLAKFARLAAARGQTESAARGFGAIEAALAATIKFVDIDERSPYEQHRAWVQAAMPPEVFASGVTAGRALTLEQALQELLAFETVAVHSMPAPAAPLLRLMGLGPAQVLREGPAPIAWPYAKVKELLFYLASYPARTKAQIGLALWPEASPSQLRNSLGTTLYHLRRALGQPEWIVFEADQYHFNRALGSVFDVDAFEAHLTRAARLKTQASEQALEPLEAAVALYQGDFVEDYLAGEWFLLRREELRRKFLGALLELGQLRFAQGAFAAAADAFRRAIDKDPIWETAHRELMRCFMRQGERSQALRHYETLAHIMRAELGSPPAPESLALYERLKRGEPV